MWLDQGLFGRIVTALGTRIFIDPGPQEDEMVCGQPFEKGQDFVQVTRIERVGIGLQFLDGLAHQAEHGRMVIDGLADITQGKAEVREQALNLILAQGIQHDDDYGFALRRAIAAV